MTGFPDMSKISQTIEAEGLASGAVHKKSALDPSFTGFGALVTGDLATGLTAKYRVPFYENINSLLTDVHFDLHFI